MAIYDHVQGDITKTYHFTIRLRWRCGACGANWKISEQSDCKMGYVDQREASWAEMPCPTCGKRVILREQAQPGIK